jgi:hypothetical protein
MHTCIHEHIDNVIAVMNYRTLLVAEREVMPVGGFNGAFFKSFKRILRSFAAWRVKGCPITS